MVDTVNSSFQFSARGSSQTALLSNILELPRSGKREILQESFLTTSKKKLALELTSPVAGFRINNAAQFLRNRFQSTGFPVADNLDRRKDFMNIQIATLRSLKKSFEQLRTDVSELRQTGSLQTRFARSQRPKNLIATATNGSPEGAFNVVPSQSSAVNVLVSDEQRTPFAALGLTGSFFVNGFKVSVSSTDSIVELRDKINFGEDTNKNGSLDLLEDVNNNGVAEILIREPTEFGPGLFIKEDINDNGILEGSEDANGNDRLDGGSQEIQVSASIQRNRLFLTSLAGGQTEIDLKDSDDILFSIGFFVKDKTGILTVQKETEIDFDNNPPQELIQLPQQALLQVDGTAQISATNIFNEAVDDTRLEIKGETELNTRVTISIDTARAVASIKNFFNDFNKSITQLNRILSDNRVFERDPDIQKIRLGLVNGAQDRIREINRNNQIKNVSLTNRRNLTTTGLKIVNPQKNSVQEITLGRIVNKIQKGITSPFHNPGPETLRRLFSVGIQTNEDNTVDVNTLDLGNALVFNKANVLDILNNEETGLLPKLENELSRILKEGLGDIDLKRTAVILKADIPKEVSGGFEQSIVSDSLEGFARLLQNAELGGIGSNLNTVA